MTLNKKNAHHMFYLRKKKLKMYRYAPYSKMLILHNTAPLIEASDAQLKGQYLHFSSFISCYNVFPH